MQAESSPRLEPSRGDRFGRNPEDLIDDENVHL